ncbi:MAG: NCS2 family permease [bacterium]|nr:NCS2 family permease [bacterium]
MKINFKNEVIAGITTFLAMAYIIFINPAILVNANMPFEDVMIATCLVSAITTFLMGVLSNYPFAMAPGMGLNAVVAYQIVKNMGYPWQVAMAVVFWEGVIITILVLTKLRKIVFDVIPLEIKKAISVGIGVFISFIGFKNAGFVIKNPDTFITFGDFTNPATLLAAFGLLITVFFMLKKITGAILLGMLTTGFIGIITAIIPPPDSIFSPPRMPSTFMQLDFLKAFDFELLPVLFSLLMVDFFDTLGTVVGIGSKFMDQNKNLPKLNRVLLADSFGPIIGGIFATSSSTTYVESAAGIKSGGSTYITSIVVSILFLLSIPFSGIVATIGGSVGELFPITAPALILIGFLMIDVIKELDFNSIENGIPNFLTIFATVFTFSISHGIGFGIISYCVIRILKGKFNELNLPIIFVAALFAIFFIIK